MALTQINNITISSKIINAAKKRQFIGLAKNAANTRLVFAKQNLLEEIDENEISKELLPGAESNPNSELISGGSLRAFIGFYPEDNPVQDLKDYFNENIKISSDPKITDNGKNKIYYNFKVNIPSMTQINNAEQFQTPDNWRNESWITVIEKGTSTAVHFVMALLTETADKFSKAGSRSGYGLQKSNVFTDKIFTPKPYISDIINNFINRFK
jgi:hypothetical protein